MRTIKNPKSRKTGWVLVLFFLLFSLPLCAGEFVDEFSEVVPVAEGGKVVVETFGGSVSFTVWESENDVRIEATRMVHADSEDEAQCLFSDYRIFVKKSMNKVTVKTLLPEDRSFFTKIFGAGRHNHIQVDYRLFVPRNIDIHIDGTSTDVQGGGIDGRVSLDLTSGDVDLQNIGGYVFVDGTSGDVKVTNVGGDLSVDNTSGDITASNVGGDIGIDKTTGTVNLKNVGGDLYLDGTSCDVEIDNIAGDVEVDVTSGDLKVLGLGGGITYEGTSGSVFAAFDGLLDTPCSISTTSGDVELAVAENSGFNLKLETSNGEIRARLPSMEILELSSDNLRAVIAGGGVEVYVETGSGDIFIERN